MRSEIFNDTVILIGQNAQENWDLIDFESDFIWLHLNSFPSCHVIIKHENPDNDTLQVAAEMCKENTKYRNLKNLKICYTKCSNLKKGSDVGSVIYKSKRQVKTILI
jgi:predicted ribosome quality control (RQC) complex YloA/Tae2 family protein